MFHWRQQLLARRIGRQSVLVAAVAAAAKAEENLETDFFK